MSAVAVADSKQRAKAEAPSAVRERLEEFGEEVLAEATNRPAQMANGGLYLRGLLEEGRRKSLEPLVARLHSEADYQSMQQFLTDSPWEAAAVLRAVAERVVAAIEVEAWVLDDTGFPKDGKDSPGVKRQYSGTLGKIGNCQIGVSVHAVGAKGTVPLGWALYLPEEWCSDAERRAKAKIPAEVAFKTKPELGWGSFSAPRAGMCRWPPCSATPPTATTPSSRDGLHGEGLEYVFFGLTGDDRVRAGDEVHRARATARQARPAHRSPAPRPRGALDRRSDRPRGREAPEDGHLPRRSRGRANHLPIRLREGPRRPQLAPRRRQMARGCQGSAPRGVADRRVARGRGGTDRLLALQPTHRHRARAPRAVALEGRARLSPAEGRAWPRSLRGPLLPGLAPPHRAGQRRPRLPHPGAPSPKSPAAGLTLPAAVRTLQPAFKCWTGRCQTCLQLVDLERLDSLLARRDE